MTKTALLGLALVAALSAAVGCADEDPEALVDRTSEPDDAPREPPPDDDDDAPSDADRSDYVDAIAASAMAGGPDDLRLPADEAECVAETYVDLVGLDELQRNVTPEQIAGSDFGATSWGIDLTQDEGEDLFDGMVACSPTIGHTLVEAVTGGMNEVADFEFDVDCLAADEVFVRKFGAAALAQGADLAFEEEEAGELVDWLAGCTDMRALTVDVMTASGVPASAAACISMRMDDELVHRFWTESFVHADDPETMTESPVVAEITAIAEACADTTTPTDI